MNRLPLYAIAGAAICSALLYVILKYFQKWKIDNLQGLTFNYITASILSFLLANTARKVIVAELPAFLLPACITGILFISVFYLTALTAQRAGLSIASIASKMSMAIPITAGFIFFGDELNWIRVTGILLAFVAVISAGRVKSDGNKSISAGVILLPVLLFIGSGLVDTSIKLSEHYLLNSGNTNLYFSLIFGVAGIAGIIMVLKRIKSGHPVQGRSVAGGILLGVVNYISLAFLVNALAAPGAESALVFAIVNMLVVIVTTVAGIILFREKPTNTNLAGLGVAVLAIALLSI